MYREARVVKRKNKWAVISEKGKTLGEYDSKEDALARLRAIEYFKHHKGEYSSMTINPWLETTNTGQQSFIISTSPELTTPPDADKTKSDLPSSELARALKTRQPAEGWGKRHKRNEEPTPEVLMVTEPQYESLPTSRAWLVTAEITRENVFAQSPYQTLLQKFQEIIPELEKIPAVQPLLASIAENFSILIGAAQQIEPTRFESKTEQASLRKDAEDQPATSRTAPEFSDWLKTVQSPDAETRMVPREPETPPSPQPSPIGETPKPTAPASLELITRSIVLLADGLSQILAVLPADVSSELRQSVSEIHADLQQAHELAQRAVERAGIGEETSFFEMVQSDEFREFVKSMGHDPDKLPWDRPSETYTQRKGPEMSLRDLYDLYLKQKGKKPQADYAGAASQFVRQLIELSKSAPKTYVPWIKDFVQMYDSNRKAMTAPAASAGVETYRVDTSSPEASYLTSAQSLMSQLKRILKSYQLCNVTEGATALPDVALTYINSGQAAKDFETLAQWAGTIKETAPTLLTAFDKKFQDMFKQSADEIDAAIEGLKQFQKSYEELSSTQMGTSFPMGETSFHPQQTEMQKIRKQFKPSPQEEKMLASIGPALRLVASIKDTMADVVSNTSGLVKRLQSVGDTVSGMKTFFANPSKKTDEMMTELAKLCTALTPLMTVTLATGESVQNKLAEFVGGVIGDPKGLSDLATAMETQSFVSSSSLMDLNQEPAFHAESAANDLRELLARYHAKPSPELVTEAITAIGSWDDVAAIYSAVRSDPAAVELLKSYVSSSAAAELGYPRASQMDDPENPLAMMLNEMFQAQAFEPFMTALDPASLKAALVKARTWDDVLLLARNAYSEPLMDEMKQFIASPASQKLGYPREHIGRGSDRDMAELLTTAFDGDGAAVAQYLSDLFVKSETAESPKVQTNLLLNLRNFLDSHFKGAGRDVAMKNIQPAVSEQKVKKGPTEEIVADTFYCMESGFAVDVLETPALKEAGAWASLMAFSDESAKQWSQETFGIDPDDEQFEAKVEQAKKDAYLTGIAPVIKQLKSARPDLFLTGPVTKETKPLTESQQRARQALVTIYPKAALVPGTKTMSKAEALDQVSGFAYDQLAQLMLRSFKTGLDKCVKTTTQAQRLLAAMPTVMAASRHLLQKTDWLAMTKALLAPIMEYMQKWDPTKPPEYPSGIEPAMVTRQTAGLKVLADAGVILPKFVAKIQQLFERTFDDRYMLLAKGIQDKLKELAGGKITAQPPAPLGEVMLPESELESLRESM